MAKKVKTKAKKASPTLQMKRYGILSPFGKIWSPDTFCDPRAAEQHVIDFWSDIKGHKKAEFAIVRVSVTVRPLKTVSPRLVKA
jgi:hypothetical protein